MFIAYNRKHITYEQAPVFCLSIEDFAREYDVIFGPTADDRCFYRLESFLDPICPLVQSNHVDALLRVRKNPLRTQYLIKSTALCSLFTKQLKNFYTFSPEEKYNSFQHYLEEDQKWFASAKTIRVKTKSLPSKGLLLKDVIDKLVVENITFQDLLVDTSFGIILKKMITCF